MLDVRPDLEVVGVGRRRTVGDRRTRRSSTRTSCSWTTACPSSTASSRRPRSPTCPGAAVVVLTATRRATASSRPCSRPAPSPCLTKDSRARRDRRGDPQRRAARCVSPSESTAVVLDSTADLPDRRRATSELARRPALRPLRRRDLPRPRRPVRRGLLRAPPRAGEPRQTSQPTPATSRRVRGARRLRAGPLRH